MATKPKKPKNTATPPGPLGQPPKVQSDKAQGQLLGPPISSGRKMASPRTRPRRRLFPRRARKARRRSFFLKT